MDWPREESAEIRLVRYCNALDSSVERPSWAHANSPLSTASWSMVGAAVGAGVSVGRGGAVGKGVDGTVDGVAVAEGVFVGKAAGVGVGDGFGVTAWVGTVVETGVDVTISVGGSTAEVGGIGVGSGVGSGVAGGAGLEQPKLIAASNTTRKGVVFPRRQTFIDYRLAKKPGDAAGRKPPHPP